MCVVPHTPTPFAPYPHFTPLDPAPTLPLPYCLPGNTVYFTRLLLRTHVCRLFICLYHALAAFLFLRLFVCADVTCARTWRGESDFVALVLCTCALHCAHRTLHTYAHLPGGHHTHYPTPRPAVTFNLTITTYPLYLHTYHATSYGYAHLALGCYMLLLWDHHRHATPALPRPHIYHHRFFPTFGSSCHAVPLPSYLRAQFKRLYTRTSCAIYLLPAFYGVLYFGG